MRNTLKSCFLVIVITAVVLPSYCVGCAAASDVSGPDAPDVPGVADTPTVPDPGNADEVMDSIDNQDDSVTSDVTQDSTQDSTQDGTQDGTQDVAIDTAPDVPTAIGCNGSESLCGKRFNEVAYPTSHNGMSNEDEGWIAPNQGHGLERQLEDGVRAMMLDLWYGDGDTTDPATVYLCHGACALGNRPLADALIAFKTFLDTHPRDVLTLIFESYVDAVDVAATFDAAGLAPYLHTQNAAEPWPSLDSMGVSGRRLVVLTDHDPGTPAWYHDEWAYTFENPWSAKTDVELSCDIDRGRQSNGLFTLNHFTSNPFPTPEEALITNSNPFFLETAQKCQTARGHIPNFVSVNFYELGDVFKVVRTLNGLDDSPAP